MSTIKSTDDLRVDVSGIRHAYRILTDNEKGQVDLIKDCGQHLWDVIDGMEATRPGQARSYSLAKTKLEESVMWAVHGVTNPHDEEGR